MYRGVAGPGGPTSLEGPAVEPEPNVPPPGIHPAMTPPSRPPSRSRRSPPRLLSGIVVAVLWALPATAGPLNAQTAVIDEGTFLLSRDGRAVGTESFTIRRTGRGEEARLVITGEARIETDGLERRITSALEVTGPALRVTAYQVKEGGDTTHEVYMTLTGRRFQATLRSPEGEELREYRASPRAVVLGDGLAHHFYVLGARARAGVTDVPVIVPRTGEGMGLRIDDRGTERVSIAGQMVQGRRLVVENGGETRDVWLDEEGRVLRVVNRTTGFRAERRNLPG